MALQCSRSTFVLDYKVKQLLVHKKNIQEKKTEQKHDEVRLNKSGDVNFKPSGLGSDKTHGLRSFVRWCHTPRDGALDAALVTVPFPDTGQTGKDESNSEQQGRGLSGTGLTGSVALQSSLRSDPCSLSRKSARSEIQVLAPF